MLDSKRFCFSFLRRPCLIVRWLMSFVLLQLASIKASKEALLQRRPVYYFLEFKRIEGMTHSPDSRSSTCRVGCLCRPRASRGWFRLLVYVRRNDNLFMANLWWRTLFSLLIDAATISNMLARGHGAWVEPVVCPDGVSH